MTRNKIVLVPFPYDDFSSAKVRPALCLTAEIGEHKHGIIAFITSKIPTDITDSDIIIKKDSENSTGTGLVVDSVIRLHRMVVIPVFMDNYLYWNTRGDHYSFAGKSFKDWQKTGHDINSIVADPFFSNPGDYDFQIVNNRNIRRIGFKPFDYTKAGVYGDASWIEKARLSDDVLKEFDTEVKKNMDR